MSTLIQDRDPIMYYFDKCPRCKYTVPANKAELVKIMFNRDAEWTVDAIDEWYCVFCDYNFSSIYHIDEPIWYDPKCIGVVEDTELSHYNDNYDFDFYLCCGTYTDICACEDPISMDTMEIELACEGITEDDFYELSVDKPGVDCSSCLRMGTETCAKYVGKLIQIAQKQPKDAILITPCSQYLFNENRIDRYHFGSLTRQAVLTAYPETRKVELNV